MKLIQESIFNFCFQRDNKLIIKDNSDVKQVELCHITHITCHGYLSKVHTIQNNFISTIRTLKSFEIELYRFGFLRANRNTVVNMLHAFEINHNSKTRIIKIREKEINISRRKFRLFKAFIYNYNK